MKPIEQKVIYMLRNGPRWVASFRNVKSIINNLIDQGVIERCSSGTSRAKNMIRLREKKNGE